MNFVDVLGKRDEGRKFGVALSTAALRAADKAMTLAVQHRIVDNHVVAAPFGISEVCKLRTPIYRLHVGAASDAWGRGQRGGVRLNHIEQL